MKEFDKGDIVRIKPELLGLLQQPVVVFGEIIESPLEALNWDGMKPRLIEELEDDDEGISCAILTFCDVDTQPEQEADEDEDSKSTLSIRTEWLEHAPTLTAMN